MAFGLDVDPVAAERVLVGHAVDPAVTAAADRPAGIGQAAAEAHREEERDDKPLEECRIRVNHAVEQLDPEYRAELGMRADDHFVGCSVRDGAGRVNRLFIMIV